VGENSGFLVLGIAAVLFINSMVRELFNVPLEATEIYAAYAFTLIVFFPLAYLQNRQKHVRMTLIVQKIHGNTTHALMLFYSLITIAIFTVILIASYNSFIVAFKTGEYSATVIHVPTCIAWGIIIFGIFLWLIELLSELIRSIRALFLN